MFRRKFIMFLIRRRLGLRKYEGFQFEGQKSKDNWYFFGGMGDLWKMEYVGDQCTQIESRVSLNHILSDECKKSIRKNGKWWPVFEDEDEGEL